MRYCGSCVVEFYNEERPHGTLRGLTSAKAAELARGTDGEHNTNPGLQP